MVKRKLEPKVEQLFHPDSYGYRPKKSALDAVGTCRTRCWRYDWVVYLDTRGRTSRTKLRFLLRVVLRVFAFAWIHAGEGAYRRTEDLIRELLTAANPARSLPPRTSATSEE